MVMNTATAKAGSLTATAKATVAIVASSGSGSLPSPWATKDIGAVAATGSASYSGGTFTVAGSGADIGSSKDEFRYVYQQANGDCTMVAKVLTVQNVNNAAMAGVMIRETLTDSSAHAAVLVTPGNGIVFKTRTSSGGSTSTKTTSGKVAPYWVKVVRAGNSFTGSHSPDGTTWTSMGSVNITMGSSVYIGLGVSSHKDGTLCTGTFNNVTPTP